MTAASTSTSTPRGARRAAREQALATLERLWTDQPERRADIWSEVWSGNDDPPAEIIRFLLAGGPRMVTYLRHDTLRFSGYLGDVPARILRLARGNTEVAALLATTGEPRLLAALEAAFVEGFHHHASYSHDIPVHPLWEDDRPTPLLDNPHLPRPAGDDLELAALMALKRRYDLMTGFDGKDMVFRLLQMLRYEPPAPAVDALRLALRAFPPGPARDSVCWWAMGLDDEATAAAVEAGYRPAEPDLVPIFLVLTGQWSSTDDDSALYDFIVGGGLDDRRAGPSPVTLQVSDFKRDELCEAAAEAGRPMPCDPREFGTPDRYRPGGTGIAGTGGFTAHS
ncbi:hypothetical protein [Dactylosporangium matsuzakiense]|uniref:Uncharacterized protein n=1 Tax=Dactylosporangium matsuzakiense TaxID=53360 RepID=A0A9W6NLD5_9ACTN|nr:hypothetical protein [Dactylosporangium matsuzakiense]UWZ41099.1 hypothetical protein Dmats_25630 [Dactylosporangium matsuzakiense]GLL01003.1 hypothetical protein GCM10017581_027440 [Dactylosporangium matsuzakiense]